MNKFKSDFIDKETGNGVSINVSYEIIAGRDETLTEPSEDSEIEIDALINGTNVTDEISLYCMERLEREAWEHAANEHETDYSKE